MKLSTNHGRARDSLNSLNMSVGMSKLYFSGGDLTEATEYLNMAVWILEKRFPMQDCFPKIGSGTVRRLTRNFCRKVGNII